MAPPTAFEKDESDRAAIKDDLNLLEAVFVRHGTTALTEPETDGYLRKAAQIQLDLSENMKNMRHHAPRATDLSSQSAEYTDMYCQASRLHSNFHGIKMAFPVAATSAPPPTPTPSSGAPFQQIRLPTLEIPKFGGNMQEWQSFRDLFTTAIDKSSLTKVEKLTHLKTLLTGEAAKQIRNLTLCDANYDIAWTTLKERYENKRELVVAVIKRLLSHPVITSTTATAVRSLVDTTKECVRSLEVLGVPTQHWDNLIFYVLYTKLDNPSRELWVQGLPDNNIPDLAKMYEFVEKRAQALESNNTPTLRQQQPRPSQNHVRAHHADSTARCPLGCSRKHALFMCEAFQKLSPNQRQKEVKRLNRCINCLSEGHQSSNCRSKYTCKTCKCKHHSMLHFNTDIGSQQDQGGAQSHHIYSNDAIRTGLLATALVKVHTAIGGNMRRTLLDNGSTNSFITERAAKAMRLTLRPVHIPVSGLQESSCGRVKHVTTFKLSPHFDSPSSLTVTALVVNKISSSIPSERIKKDDWFHLNGLTLADPEFHIPNPVEILLGTEHFWNILENEKIHGEDGQPLACKSSLGWLVAGPNNTSTPVSVFNTNIDLNFTLSRFWDQENFLEDKLSREEKECEDHFAANHTRDSTGRFTVSLPLKTQETKLGESRHQAKRRFLSMEHKFGGNKSNLSAENNRKLLSQWNEYKSFMQEYESLGHMEPVPAEDLSTTNPVYYIPHHSVVKESSTTTKLRVVFDASASTSTGISLNDCLMVGPRLQDDISEIMLRFRMHPIAFTADIAKMYRQIRVTPKDTDLQRILWRSDPSLPIQEYRLLTVTYGTSSAPYQAVKCLQQLAADEQNRFPEGSKIALNNFYVDDTASGCQTVEQAKEVVKQLRDLCMSGGLELRKWTTNSQELLDTIPEEMRETNSLVELQHHDPTIKTLGVFWNPATDKYLFKVNLPPDMPGNYSKRIILSDIAKIYDPLGWLSPVIIVCKMLMQDLWKLLIDWDDILPEDVQIKWKDIKESLEDLTKLEIPRCVIGPYNKRLLLVGCCDASTKAISACVYLCSWDTNMEPTCHLLTSKTKVAPIKFVTLPKLELDGAVLVSKLMKSTIKALKFPISEVRAFTDSTITLHWVTSPPSRWKPYIRRRVQAVQENIPTASWFHIPGNINPADCASRGITPSELLHHSLWWKGTPYFFSPDSSPTELGDEDLIHLDEEAKPKVHLAQPIPLPEVFTKYSSFRKLQRIVAYILRFANNWVRPNHNTPLQKGPLTVHELQSSSFFIIRQLQYYSFPSEMAMISEQKQLPSNNNLVKLQPFLCDRGLLRVGGRLRNANIHYDSKHQLLLPKSHPITVSIIWDIHHRQFHAGPSATLAAFNQHYWVTNGRDTIRYVLRKCVTCSRHHATMMKQVMADLPFDRVNPSKPFSKVGVDYAGPFIIRPMVRSKVTLKCWIALFVCFATRAIHIEVVSTLSTDGFLAALRRFTYRRGVPNHIYSDCGSNFKSGEKVLRDFFCVTREADIQNAAASQGITWHFNPAGAPHFGGLWEAGVKSIKYHLKRVMGPSKLTFEEMTTLLTQIEGILNSRPLVPASADPSDLGVLTPAHFLIGSAITTIPEPSLLDIQENHLNRWQRLQQQKQLFWKRWSQEFITRLQQRPKWWTPAPNLAVGHLVIIKDERLPPLKWKMGRVTAIHPGKDGHVRVASLKTAEGVIKRPIAKLSLLPISI